MKTSILALSLFVMSFSNCQAATVCTAFCTNVLSTESFVVTLIATASDREAAESKLEKKCTTMYGKLGSAFGISLTYNPRAIVEPGNRYEISCDEI